MLKRIHDTKFASLQKFIVDRFNILESKIDALSTPKPTINEDDSFSSLTRFLSDMTIPVTNTPPQPHAAGQQSGAGDAQSRVSNRPSSFSTIDLPALSALLTNDSSVQTIPAPPPAPETIPLAPTLQQTLLRNQDPPETITRAPTLQQTLPRNQDPPETITRAPTLHQALPRNPPDLSGLRLNIQELKLKAGDNRQYFAWVLAREVFTKEDMRGRNWTGNSGTNKAPEGKKKGRLPMGKRDLIYEIIEEHYPFGSTDRKEHWHKCTARIDNGIRHVMGKDNFLDEHEEYELP